MLLTSRLLLLLLLLLRLAAFTPLRYLFAPR
jgi:hypothetical protein